MHTCTSPKATILIGITDVIETLKADATSEIYGQRTRKGAAPEAGVEEGTNTGASNRVDFE